ASLGQDGEDDGEQEASRHDRKFIGQDLAEYDPHRSLARDPGGQYVVAISDGQRLGALHPGAPRPAGDADHDRDAQRPLAGKVPGQDDDERQGRNDQEDVGEDGQDLIGHAAQVAPQDPDEQGQHGGYQAGDEPDEERDAGAVDQLSQDVLPR